MTIAYIISAYKYPKQLARLVTSLNRNGASFFVHVDKKTDSRVYQAMVSNLSHLPNVHWLPRHTCNWGGFGHVAATLEGIRAICTYNATCDYVVLLTGQDYPIKTNDYIQCFFQEHEGKQFLEYFPIPTVFWQDGGLERIESWHFRLLYRHFKVPHKHGFVLKRQFPPGYKPYGGSSYWCLSRKCIDYIYDFVKRNDKFIRFFKYVDVPDELFFQTIVLNSPFADRVVNDDLRYIDWKDPNSGSPSVLDKSDFQRMARSPKLFARKFDISVDAEVLDLIDQRSLDCSR